MPCQVVSLHLRRVLHQFPRQRRFQRRFRRNIRIGDSRVRFSDTHDQMTDIALAHPIKHFGDGLCEARQGEVLGLGVGGEGSILRVHRRLVYGCCCCCHIDGAVFLLRCGRDGYVVYGVVEEIQSGVHGDFGDFYCEFGWVKDVVRGAQRFVLLFRLEQDNILFSLQRDMINQSIDRLIYK